MHHERGPLSNIGRDSVTWKQRVVMGPNRLDFIVSLWSVTWKFIEEAGNLNVQILVWPIKEDKYIHTPSKLQLCHENVMRCLRDKIESLSGKYDIYNFVRTLQWTIWISKLPLCQENVMNEKLAILWWLCNEPFEWQSYNSVIKM